MPRNPVEFEGHPQEFPERMYRGFCRHVVDGDTMDVLVDYGFNAYGYATIRLRDVDTPEIYRPKTDEERERGFAARLFVEERILNHPVRLWTWKDETSFGRYTARIEFYDEGTAAWVDLGDELRAAGFDDSEAA